MSRAIDQFKEKIGVERIYTTDASVSPLIGVGTFGREWVKKVLVDYGFDWGPLIVLLKGTRGIYFYSQERYVGTMKEGLALYKKEGEDMPLLRKFREAWERSKILTEEYDIRSVAHMPDEKLHRFFEPAFDIVQSILSATIFSEEINPKDIEAEFIAAGGANEGFDEFFATASLLTFESFALRLDRGMVSDVPDSDIQYLFANYFSTPSLSDVARHRAQVLAQHGGIEGMIREIKKIETEVEESKKKVSAYRATLNPQLTVIFDFIQCCMWLRDVRKQSYNSLYNFACEAARELCRRNGVDASLAVYLMPEEMAENGPWSDERKAEMKRRATEGVIFYTDKDSTITEYGDIETLRQEMFKIVDQSQDTLEIKGSVAYKGKVQAKAQIIMTEQEFPSFERGSVLVTSMTRPEFVPLMKMASAVVTDEGGITCHAAIVSRELKLPCIIGTKNATRILASGDIVEVDADKGIVRKI